MGLLVENFNLNEGQLTFYNPSAILMAKHQPSNRRGPFGNIFFCNELKVLLKIRIKSNLALKAH